MTIDTVVMSFMKSIESPSLTSFTKVLSDVTEPMVLLVVSIFLSGWIYFKKSKKEGILFASTIIIASILVKVLKEIFQKARPLDSLITETSYSFPSGHALISIVFFGLLVFIFMKKKNNWLKISSAILAVILIDFSRLYLRVHWFSDVFFGFLIGGIILFSAIIFYKKNRR